VYANAMNYGHVSGSALDDTSKARWIYRSLTR
jgi:hypothetical protein